MNNVTLLAIMANGTLLLSITAMLHQLDSKTRWVGGLTLLMAGYVLAAVSKFIIAYMDTAGGYVSLGVMYWVVYFCEHFVEAILWNTLADMAQLRSGRRTLTDIHIIDNAVRIMAILMLCCGLGIVLRGITTDLAVAIYAIRQLTLFLSICSCLMEFLQAFWRSMLVTDDTMLFKNRTMALILFLPTVTFIGALMLCGIPVMHLGERCRIAEMVHLNMFCLALNVVWYWIILQNGIRCSRTPDLQKNGRTLPTPPAVSEGAFNGSSLPRWVRWLH